MVKFQKGPATSGPSSSLGIMRFFDAESPGPKITPEFVVGLAIIVMVVVLIIKHFI
ncbi:MAG: preprotein translocase subunit Sec61beta [Candidatus Diapherotrites archaeon]|nr:preprotein translocase subunit Sec61beta [Candidatus Diapherotrites archaeon]